MKDRYFAGEADALKKAAPEANTETLRSSTKETANSSVGGTSEVPQASTEAKTDGFAAAGAPAMSRPSRNAGAKKDATVQTEASSEGMPATSKTEG